MWSLVRANQDISKVLCSRVIPSAALRSAITVAAGPNETLQGILEALELCMPSRHFMPLSP
jgi:hypothetical protein